MRIRAAGNRLRTLGEDSASKCVYVLLGITFRPRLLKGAEREEALSKLYGIARDVARRRVDISGRERYGSRRRYHGRGASTPSRIQISRRARFTV